MAAHPDDHVRDRGGGDERHDGLELLLADLRQVLVEDLKRDAEADAEQDGDADACPHRAQRVLAARGGQERRDDDDDQRRLEAFAQADDERWQHVSSSWKGIAAGPCMANLTGELPDSVRHPLQLDRSDHCNHHHPAAVPYTALTDS